MHLGLTYFEDVNTFYGKSHISRLLCDLEITWKGRSQEKYPESKYGLREKLESCCRPVFMKGSFAAKQIAISGVSITSKRFRYLNQCKVPLIF